MKDEALKLASALDHWATQMDMGRKPDPKSLIRKASAELRRLQAELDATKQALAAQPAPVQEPIYQMQMMDGKWIDQAKQSYEYNKAHGHTVRIVYTAAQPAPVQEPVIAGSLSVRYFRGCKSMTNADFDYEGDLPEGDYTLYTTPPAQPAPVQEPVAKKTGIGLVTSNGWDSLPVGTLFYTTPPAAQRQWVGLTDEEADNFLKAVWGREVTPKHFIQAIESKLKEKNT
jgi:hypothetical protein